MLFPSINRPYGVLTVMGHSKISIDYCNLADETISLNAS